MVNDHKNIENTIKIEDNILTAEDFIVTSQIGLTLMDALCLAYIFIYQKFTCDNNKRINDQL